MSENPEPYLTRTPEPEPLDKLAILKLIDQANETLAMLYWLLENPRYISGDPVGRIKSYTAALIKSADELQTYINKL